MLRINTFTLTNNFARRTYEFYDDKLIWKLKSLTLETDGEIKFEDIKAMICKKVILINWLWSMTWLSWGILVLDFILRSRGNDLTIIVIVEKFLIISGLVLGIINSQWKEYWSFLDKDQNYLATIHVAKKDRNNLSKAIELIKQKTNLRSETHPENPFPNIAPKFEIIQYDIPDFLNKSTTRVYEDKIIEAEVSLLEKQVTETIFQDLSDKTKKIKAGNSSWENQWCLGFLIMPTVYMLLNLFFQYKLSVYILAAGLFLPVLLSLLKYIKLEYLVFYNKDDRVQFWMIRNKRDQAKVDMIEEYIKQQVLALKG